MWYTITVKLCEKLIIVFCVFIVILTQKQLDNDYTKTDWRVDNKYFLFPCGTYTAIKGMPTTIEIQNSGE